MTEIGESALASQAARAGSAARARRGTKRDLHFAIRHYAGYASYTWKPFHSSNPDDYGEIGDDAFGCNGDRAATVPMQDGFVYVLDGKTLLKTFAVQGGVYQEVKITASDVSHAAKVGPARPYMVVEGWWPEDDGDFGRPVHVVASAIKLSKHRLFEAADAITKDPSRRGTRVSVSRRRLREAERDPRSGPAIFADYQDGKKGPDLVTYDYRRAGFDGMDGFQLLLPDVAGEARRRNALYRARLATYHGWLYDERRNEEQYVARAIESIVQKDPSKRSYVNQARLEEWNRGDTEQFRRRFFPVHFAAESLLRWLRHRSFSELLKDYNHGTDEDQVAGHGLYGDAIADLHFTQAGAEYLKAQYDDTRSYFHLSTRILELKHGYDDPYGTENAIFALRKWTNVAYGVMEEFVGTMVAKESDGARELFLEVVYKRSGIRLRQVRVQPVAYLERWVELPQIDAAIGKISSWPDSKAGRGLVTFVEGVNVALAFWAVARADNTEDRVKGTVNVGGAVLDFLSSNWAFKGAVDKLAMRYSGRHIGRIAGRSIPVMIVVSGIVDAVLAGWEIKSAWQRGDYDVTIGWAAVVFGGALIAVGGLKLMAAGGAVTLGSGGAGAAPGAAMVVAGLVLEGVGLALVWLLNNDEVEDWIARSTFGRKPAGTSLREQMQKLNDILCKFEIDAEFEDIPGKFSNLTAVTLVIEPRAITDRSILKLTGLQGHAEARFVEMINPFSNRHDLAMGAEGLGDFVVDLNRIDPAAVTREDGRITEIRVRIHCQMDIDEVRGSACLDLNNGTLQGYTRAFTVEA